MYGSGCLWFTAPLHLFLTNKQRQTLLFQGPHIFTPKPHAFIATLPNLNPGPHRRYGMDCSRKRANSKIEPDDRTAHGKVWLEQVLTPTLAAADPPASPTRRRPFVYVYDTLPDYNTDIMQYRCVRRYGKWSRGRGKGRGAGVGQREEGQVQPDHRECVGLAPHTTPHTTRPTLCCPLTHSVREGRRSTGCARQAPALHTARPTLRRPRAHASCT
eukprot:358852-Chlamydomonas_euryale.AAC.2